MRFYTLPPSGIEWPYLLVNPRNYKQLYKRKWEKAILDCGVEIFSNPNTFDYSKVFLYRWKHLARQLTQIFGDHLLVTVPDYPDDLAHQFNGENVEKTLRNVEDFLSIDGVNWLIPLQAQCLNPFSFFESCYHTKELIGNYPWVAIGTVCKTHKLNFIEYSCKVARTHFPNSHIHAFGLTLKALPRVIPTRKSWDSMVPDCGRKMWIDSWDSLSFTKGLKSFSNGGRQAGTLKERERFFWAYITRINQILGDQS